jgi:DNA polymerase-3 subunit epsilon
MSLANRIVVLDTETTGLDLNRDRIVEFGAVVLDGFEEVEHFQFYFNPNCIIHPNTVKVHGLSNEFLSKFESFNGKKVQNVIQNSPLVIHNAKFDIGFLNKEFDLCGIAPIMNQVIDTLDIARQTFPGAPANLDALCNKFKITNNQRKLHGALLDAMLLTKVYSCLRGHGTTKINFASTSKRSTVLLSDVPVNVTSDENDQYYKMYTKLIRPI